MRILIGCLIGVIEALCIDTLKLPNLESVGLCVVLGVVTGIAFYLFEGKI